MKTLVILISCIVVSINLKSQILNSDTLTTIAYWEQGETYMYQLDKYRFNQKGAEITEKITRSFIRFYIQEATDSNYIIKYTIDSLSVQGELETNPILNTFISEISNKLVYLIETDENGTLIEIQNWEELRDNIVELYSQMEFFNNLNKDKRATANQAIKAMTDSKDKIQALFSKEFAVMFSNYGYVFNIRDTIEYDQYLPNPYGGDPFPQSGKIYFDTNSVDLTNSLTLFDKSAIDEEEGKKAIIQILKQLSPDLKDLESEMENVEFKIDDSIIQEYDLSNGSILKAIMERTVNSNDLKEKNVRIDRQTWKLISLE